MMEVATRSKDVQTHEFTRTEKNIPCNLDLPKDQRAEPSQAEITDLLAAKTAYSDHSLSSDNEDGQVWPETVAEADEADEAERVLGVSIGREQSRMKARHTPADEKNKALYSYGEHFESLFDDEADGENLPAMTTEPETLPDEELQPTADAKVSGDKENSRHSFTRSLLKSTLPLRPRAWSGDAIQNINFRKFIPDLSSFRRSGSASAKALSSINRPRIRSASGSGCTSPGKGSPDHTSRLAVGIDNSSEEDIPALQPINTSTTASHSYQQRPGGLHQRPSYTLRQSASDESLYVRSLSRTSTLEHRPHYEHIHSQVNSRYKAIKDSLQDSSSRLLSMPNFNFPDIRGEWNPGRFLNDTASQQKEAAQTNETQVNGGGRPIRSQSKQNTIHPILKEAMSQMTGDAIVMGGYRGSVLRSATPPHRQLWVPMKVGLNIRKVDLEVGLNPEDEERMEETIFASEVLSHIGPVDICRRLLQKLQKCENTKNGKLRVWDYGYDWRLSPLYLSRRLIQFLEGLPCNAPHVPAEKRGAYVIAHSLGGLITRHAVNQRPDLFAGVVFAGTPQHCVNILGPMRNGDEVLLSSRVLTAQVNFTFRTSFALLPEDGRCFIDKKTKEEYLVDFFSVNTWDEHSLSPCISAPLPPLGGENRKGLIDTIPTSFPSLPKMNFGKRFSTILGSKDGMTDNAGSRSSRQQGEEDSLPGDSDQEYVSQTATGPGSEVVEGLIGPNIVPNSSSSVNASIAAATTTIPRADAMAYLERTLRGVSQFKQELAFNETHQSDNRYPPLAVLYSKSLPTVYGARVASREDIKRRDSFDDLAFAAGDGVCLATAAMLPPGYRVIKDGLVRTDRGHVGLLGDLEGVGQCLLALIRGRQAGVGLGKSATREGT